MEGIVSKRRDAPYRSGRQETWIKLKCTKSNTFPIVAFVEKSAALAWLNSSAGKELRRTLRPAREGARVNRSG